MNQQIVKISEKLSLIPDDGGAESPLCELFDTVCRHCLQAYQN
jgi:hypothetical protein